MGEKCFMLLFWAAFTAGVVLGCVHCWCCCGVCSFEVLLLSAFTACVVLVCVHCWCCCG